DDYRERIEDLQEQLIAINNELQERLAPLRERLAPLRQQVEDAVRRFEPELPERPEAEPAATDEDEADWLFAPGRTYLEQSAAYHKLMPPTPRKWTPAGTAGGQRRGEERRGAERRPPKKGCPAATGCGGWTGPDHRRLTDTGPSRRAPDF